MLRGEVYYVLPHLWYCSICLIKQIFYLMLFPDDKIKVVIKMYNFTHFVSPEPKKKH